MDLNFQFNTNEWVDDNNSFDDLPAGQYIVEISIAEVKTSQAGNNGLSIGYKVLQGQFAGRMEFQWLNIYHPRGDVSQIALKQLGHIARATNVVSFNLPDASALIGKVLQITLKYNDKGYKNIYPKTLPNQQQHAPQPPLATPPPVHTVPPTPQPLEAPAPQANQADNANVPPWMRGKV